MRIPESARKNFGARDQRELAKRNEGKKVIVAGRIAIEPHPLRQGDSSENGRPTITVTDLGQIRTM